MVGVDEDPPADVPPAWSPDSAGSASVRATRSSSRPQPTGVPRARHCGAVPRCNAGVDLQLVGTGTDRVPRERLQGEGGDRRGRWASSSDSSRCAGRCRRSNRSSSSNRRISPAPTSPSPPTSRRANRPTSTPSQHRDAGRPGDDHLHVGHDRATEGRDAHPRQRGRTLESVGQTMRDQTTIDDFAGKRHVSYLPMAHIMERLIGHYYLVDMATLMACLPRDVPDGGVHPRREAEPLHRRAPGGGEALRRRQRRGRCRRGEGQAFDEAIAAALPIREDDQGQRRRGRVDPAPSSTRWCSRGCVA